MQHTCKRDNTTGVGKIFLGPMWRGMWLWLAINMHVHININVQSRFQISEWQWTCMWLWLFNSKLAINIEMNINMHINIEDGCRHGLHMGASPPNPHAFGETGFFRWYVTQKKMRCAPQGHASHTNPTQKQSDAFPPAVPFRQGMGGSLQGGESGTPLGRREACRI